MLVAIIVILPVLFNHVIIICQEEKDNSIFTNQHKPACLNPLTMISGLLIRCSFTETNHFHDRSLTTDILRSTVTISVKQRSPVICLLILSECHSWNCQRSCSFTDLLMLTSIRCNQSVHLAGTTAMPTLLLSSIAMMFVVSALAFKSAKITSAGWSERSENSASVRSLYGRSIFSMYRSVRL